MVNLKIDLLNELRNQKYYAEIELIRLAADPAMNYKIKISEIDQQLATIAILNQEISLAEVYFTEQPPQPVVAPDTVQKPFQGQSHSE